MGSWVADYGGLPRVPRVYRLIEGLPGLDVGITRICPGKELRLRVPARAARAHVAPISSRSELTNTKQAKQHRLPRLTHSDVSRHRCPSRVAVLLWRYPSSRGLSEGVRLFFIRTHLVYRYSSTYSCVCPAMRAGESPSACNSRCASCMPPQHVCFTLVCSGPRTCLFPRLLPSLLSV